MAESQRTYKDRLDRLVEILKKTEMDALLLNRTCNIRHVEACFSYNGSVRQWRSHFGRDAGDKDR